MTEAKPSCQQSTKHILLHNSEEFTSQCSFMFFARVTTMHISHVFISTYCYSSSSDKNKVLVSLHQQGEP